MGILHGLIACLCWWAAAAAEAETAPPLILEDHPLAGTIYDLEQRRTVGFPELLEGMRNATYLLLGETHDNMAQHANQVQVIEALSAAGHRPSATFEMIDDRQGEILKGRELGSAKYLVDLLNHVDTGWDYATYYLAVFNSVIGAGIPIRPANIERNRLAEMMAQEPVQWPVGLRRILADSPLPAALEHELLEEIIASHCGMLDETAARPMVAGQRLRDAAMTDSLLHDTGAQRLLFAGNGHVRKDRGVPMYLRRQVPADTVVVTLAMQEVEQDHNTLADYEAHWSAGVLPYDYVWFTPQADRGDPCADWQGKE